MKEAYIKLIFGLKLKQIRTERDLSLFGLSKLTGLSKSYLNEIEKGKKYPKPDKIAILSEKLDVPYDQMVSLKLDKNLAPIGQILQSQILKEIPLELFGIKESNLIDILSNAPSKVNAFISTVIKIAQNYNFSRESFYLASVRSFQEANKNYFEDLEQSVEKFANAFHIDLNERIQLNELEEILMEEYGYTLNDTELTQHKALGDLRSVYIPSTKTLLLNDQIGESQRTFIYAKELAYNYLKIEDRLHTFPWIKFETFDHVLNNFYASYFAGALIIPQSQIVDKLSKLFKKKKFDSQLFLEIMESFNASPESFYQRLTNILPQFFQIQNLFFLRFNHTLNSPHYYLNKELHLTQQHMPHANETDEHYCRRWVSIQIFPTLINSQSEHEFSLQISNYNNTDSKYLVLTSATKDPFQTNEFRSISIGLEINTVLKRKLKFLEDPAIKKQTVGVTCERCLVKDCELRQVEPVILEEEIKHQEIERLVEDLNKKFS